MSSGVVLIVAIVYAALAVVRAFTAGPDALGLACFVAANVWFAAWVVVT